LLLALAHLLHHRLPLLRGGSAPLLTQLCAALGRKRSHSPEGLAHRTLLLGREALELLPTLADEPLLVR
jgi:hypothetical protein